MDTREWKKYKIKYMIGKGKMVFLDHFFGLDLPGALKDFYRLHHGMGKIYILDIEDVTDA